MLARRGQLKHSYLHNRVHVRCEIINRKKLTAKLCIFLVLLLPACISAPILI